MKGYNFNADRVVDFARDYGYEINKIQGKFVLELLDNIYGGVFTKEDILEAVDYVVYKERSLYLNSFNKFVNGERCYI